MKLRRGLLCGQPAAGPPQRESTWKRFGVTIIKHPSMNVLWTRSMYFECHGLQIRCLQPCFLVLLRHLSVLVFFVLSGMAGLAGSPLPSAFSRVLAKPTTIIGSCALFVVNQFQCIAAGRGSIELCIIFLDSGTLWCIAPLRGPRMPSCQRRCTLRSGTFGSFGGLPHSPRNVQLENKFHVKLQEYQYTNSQQTVY